MSNPGRNNFDKILLHQELTLPLLTILNRLHSAELNHSFTQFDRKKRENPVKFNYLGFRRLQSQIHSISLLIVMPFYFGCGIILAKLRY
jgi:hypothetical protein